jgi:SEC-C motif-containing protein
MRKLARDPACPCGSRQPYSQCCQPYHLGHRTPESPSRLFLARYSAYALGVVPFIIDTTHPHGPVFVADTEAWRKDVLQFHRAMKFLGVHIFSHTDPSPNDDTATVTYRVLLQEKDKDASFVERAVFKRFAGRWCYDSGEFLATDTAAKTWTPQPAPSDTPKSNS